MVRGLADEVALRVDRVTAARIELTFARLLEDVAAFGGVLRAFGVGPGERVLSRLPMGADGLVAALATVRLGAVHVVSEPYDDPAAPLATHRPAVVLAEGSDSSLADALAAAGSPPDAVVWRGDLPEGHDLEWDVLMRAGRTDPAPTAEVPVSAEAFVIGDRTDLRGGGARRRHRPLAARRDRHAGGRRHRPASRCPENLMARR